MGKMLKVRFVHNLNHMALKCNYKNVLIDESDVLDLQPPKFIRELEETSSSLEGNKVILECHVTGFPQPKVKWSAIFNIKKYI